MYTNYQLHSLQYLILFSSIISYSYCTYFYHSLLLTLVRSTLYLVLTYTLSFYIFFYLLSPQLSSPSFLSYSIPTSLSTSFKSYWLLQLSSPSPALSQKSYEPEPFTVGADATIQYVWVPSFCLHMYCTAHTVHMSVPYTRSLHLLHPWQAWFCSDDSDYFWDSVPSIIIVLLTCTVQYL